jgi:hypothetical protein
MSPEENDKQKTGPVRGPGIGSERHPRSSALAATREPCGYSGTLRPFGNLAATREPRTHSGTQPAPGSVQTPQTKSTAGAGPHSVFSPERFPPEFPASLPVAGNPDRAGRARLRSNLPRANSSWETKNGSLFATATATRQFFQATDFRRRCSHDGKQPQIRSGSGTRQSRLHPTAFSCRHQAWKSSHRW